MQPAIPKHWYAFAALTAVALGSALALHPSGPLAPPQGPVADLGFEETKPDLPPDPALAALREKLTVLARRTDVGPAYKEDLAAATAFYASHRGPLLWVSAGGYSERGNAVIAELRNADDWGLSARDFAVPAPPSGNATADTVSAAEIDLTFSVLKYARYARGGRFKDLSRISKLLDYTPPVRPPKDVLAELVASESPAAYLRSLHPRNEQFERLRQALLKLRQSGAEDGGIVYGQKLQSVLPQLVRADAEAGAPERTSPDKALKIARILVNMERWRWMPTDPGAFHVWNNVPEFLTRVVSNGATIHTDRIVAGQPDWPTPAFSADMKTIVFHPSWGVPDGIKRKELMPLLRNSSGGDLFGLFTGAPSSRTVLEQHRLEAFYQGRPVDPNQVDWASANIAAYEFRQPPGPANVLGEIKFMFPNTHDVYMHDTPDKDHFAKEFRGLSHGCMRVANPRRLAEVLLKQDKGWSGQEVGKLLSGGTREVQLTSRIPVHMTYFTAMVDGDGRLKTFGDLYGLDARMGAELFGKKVAFVTPRYDAEIAAARPRSQPQQASGSPSPGLSNLADAISNIFSP